MVYGKCNFRILIIATSIVSVVIFLSIPSSLVMPDVNFVQSRIPRNIIQTSSVHTVSSKESKTFKRLNPHHEYIFFNDTEAENFVCQHMPLHIVNAFNKMPIPILKADYFRYISIYVLGGVYSDLDTICLRSIDNWADNHANVSFIVGVEAENQSTSRDLARPLQLCQWTFASIPRHPILGQLIEKIAAISEKMQNRTVNKMLVFDWTGPGIWTDTVFDFLKQRYNIEWKSLKRLERGRLIGDIYILPITGFQPTAYSMGAKGVKDPEARVTHYFWGRWKIKLSTINKAIKHQGKLYKLFYSGKKWIAHFFTNGTIRDRLFSFKL